MHESRQCRRATERGLGALVLVSRNVSTRRGYWSLSKPVVPLILGGPFPSLIGLELGDGGGARWTTTPSSGFRHSGGVILAVIASYFGGFLGIGLVGLLIGFAAVTYDLEKQDVGGGFPSPHLYAKQVAVREQMTPDERIAHRAGIHALWRPLFIAKTISIGLIVLGFGGYLFL
jgi:hypothetical protein